MEIWLRTNVRPMLFGMIPAATVGLLGLVLLCGWPSYSPPTWLRVLAGSLAVLAFGNLAIQLWQLRRPRLAYADGNLLVWLRPGPAIRVPVDAVECFWFGRVPTLLQGKRNEKLEESIIKIRIADRAAEWHRQPVSRHLGEWQDGYITIRGTWCEPLTIDVVNRLNQRLADVACAAAR